MFTVVEIAITNMKSSFRSGVRASDIEITTLTLHRAFAMWRMEFLSSAFDDNDGGIERIIKCSLKVNKLN
ncbi:hypothetical protein CTI12_AA187500 [Artemisia annua]|uniref:Uncharacterized protein n=1 Tax=Artemisia annua TaxID=35608 RepID=A0A2U1P6G0_ARTAN|nr:hypothetical protein CTI12_AA187500 [Artemisia annua]